MPKTIAGQNINYIVLDDASDTTAAVANTRKLIAESKVDIILGSTITPNSLAMIDVVSEAQTPMISMAASARIVEPMDSKRKWVFKTPQNDIMMSLAIAEHMSKIGIKTVGFIGFSDAYGEGWAQEFAKAAALKGLTVVASERFGRSDTFPYLVSEFVEGITLSDALTAKRISRCASATGAVVTPMTSAT